MARSDQRTWSVLDLLNWTKDYFARAKVDSPRLAGEVLLAHCLDCRRIELYTRYDYEPTADQLAAFRGLVARAACHEPVAYLVGHKEFYSLPFKVTGDVLIPRPESEALVTEAIGHLRRLARPGTMWDVCTGSGCVAIAAARNAEQASVLASDISAAALAVAADNAATNGVADRVRFGQGDLLDLPTTDGPAEPGGAFDVITANPPYVATDDETADEVAYEPAIALRAGCDGLDCIRRLVVDAPTHLADGGMLALEFGCGQADAVRDLIATGSAFDEPRILRDHQDIERIAVAAKR